MIVVPRRAFLVGLGLAGSALALGVAPAAAEPKENVPDGFRPNVFLHLAPTGVLSIVCKRSEMGQGVRSTLAPFIADEIGASMDKVVVVQGDGDEAYGDQNTDGSRSVRMDFDRLRRVGATARMMLIEAAAKRWGVPAASCRAQDHAVHHAATKRSLGFGELAIEASKLKVPKESDVVLRPRAELTTLNKDLPLLDAPDIVTGKARYGADITFPGMLTAVVARPPVVGGKVARHDAAKTLAVPGVRKVIVLPAPTKPFKFQPLGGVAVVADTTWAALRGRSLLDVTWDGGENATYDSHTFRSTLDASIGAKGRVARNVGNVDTALARAAKRHVAVYHAAHLAHATMEPPVAVARVAADGGSCEVWAPTQHPQAAREEVARALAIPPEKVTVHVTLLGGGFGRKSKADFISEAALVSKAVGGGTPVRVQWTREDDVRHDYYHAVSAQRLEAGLDESGAPVAWHHRTAFTPIASIYGDTASATDLDLGMGVLEVPLAIPNVRAENGPARAHTRIGWLRAVANVYHAFAVQSFIDELASLRGKDPKDNLLEIIGPSRQVSQQDLGVERLWNYSQPLTLHPIDTARHRRVVERVTELSRWSSRKSEGRALGLAVHRSFLTYVAVVVSVVRKSPTDPIRVDEAWIVADAGTIINRERVRSQLEGAVIFGLSNAMYGAITMKQGATQQSNFRDYRLMRIAEAPRAIHVDIIDNDGPSGGIGEPGVPPVAPALANAVFALTQVRVRELPLVKTVKV